MFVAACLLVVAAGVLLPAYPALVVAVVVVGIGECLHTTVLMPLVADLAPAGLRGRYMAAIGVSWWTGLAIAPTWRRGPRLGHRPRRSSGPRRGGGRGRLGTGAGA